MFLLDNLRYYKRMLDLTKINFNPSPNFGNRGGQKPQIIILHCPVGTLAGTIATFKNLTKQVSAHYIVDRDGTIVQMVQLADAAWHAMHYPNMVGIGIEMVDCYMVGGYLTRGCMADKQWFTTVQLQTVADLVAALMCQFDIPIAKVMGHNNPWLRQFGNNHQDPGPYFPWLPFRNLVQQKLQAVPIPVPRYLTQPTQENPQGLSKPRKKRGKPLRRLRRNRIYE